MSINPNSSALTPNVLRIAEAAHEYRMNFKHHKYFNVYMKESKDGIVQCRLLDTKKHPPHLAMKTLKIMDSVLTEMQGVKNLSKEDKKKLSEIRFLAKGIRDGFNAKYTKSDSKIKESLKILLGSKSEKQKVNTSAEHIETVVNTLLEKKPKTRQETLEKFEISGARAEVLQKNYEQFGHDLLSAIEIFSREVPSGIKLPKEAVKNFKINIAKVFANLRENQKSYSLQERILLGQFLKDAISQMKAKEIEELGEDKPMIDAKLLFSGGATLTDIVEGEYGKLRRELKSESEVALRHARTQEERHLIKYPPKLAQVVIAVTEDLGEAAKAGKSIFSRAIDWVKGKGEKPETHVEKETQAARKQEEEARLEKTRLREIEIRKKYGITKKKT